MSTTIKKTIAIIGVVLTIAHLTYYFINPYSFILFISGFAVLYLVFVKLFLRL